MVKKSITIMGAGFGGLAAAALLAKEGFEVSVYEKNEQPGGRASLLDEKGFRFDMGPSWFMMPDVFEKYFSEFGLNLNNVLKLIPLEPQYRVFFEDKSFYDMSSNISKNKSLFEKLEPGSGKKFDEYLIDSKAKYDISMKSVLYRNADNIFDFFDIDLIKQSKQLNAFGNVHNHVKKYFKNPKIQQMIEYNLVFLGCSPDNAPAIFSMMAHVDFNLGVFYPKGGIYEIVKQLIVLGKKFGVKYYYNSPIKRIITEGNTVKKFVVKGKTIMTNIFISNSDYKYTEDILSDQNKRTYSKSYWRKKVLTPSAFLAYLGIKGKIPKIKHHTLYFGNNWKNHFRDIFNNPAWPKEPSFYINKTSDTDKTVAPKGYENMMILVPIANGLSENIIHKQKYYEFVIDYIEKKLDVKLKDQIVYKKIFSVSDFESRYNSFKGNALGGLAHTLFQSALWRTKNKSKKLENLYFVGANTVPGIGVPPAFISSHLVTDRIKNDTK